MALKWRGLDLTNPINRIAAGFAALAENVRAYLSGGFQLRNPLSTALIDSLPTPIHTIRRLNDSTPNGPSSGYSLVIGAGTAVYVWNSDIGLVLVATGLSGNPLSMVPFRPNTSVQPWMYVADSAAAGTVTLITEYLGANSSGPAGTPVDFVSNGMFKVRSDGISYKMGVKEPQTAPVVSTQNSSVNFGGTGAMLATAIPWTNYESANTPIFDYGESEGYPNVTPPVDGTAPFNVDCQNASIILITSLALDGTVVINGDTDPTLTAQSSGRVAPGSPGFPGQFIQLSGGGAPTTASYIVGAFTDGDGNVVPAGVAPNYVPNIVDVGLAFQNATAIQVPYGAVAFQIGVNSEGNTFRQGSPPNSGRITIAGTVTTNALPSVTSILGQLSLYYWGDSPTSGPVGSYIWKNPDDPSGSGPARSTSNANGNTSNNSLIFDATFSGGIPGLPGVGTEDAAMQWTTLNPDSVATGSVPVFPAPLITTYPNQTTYSNFNFCLQGNLYFPAEGDYTLVLTSHDDCIWGIDGVTLISATASGSGESGSVGLSGAGQTLTVVGGYPLLPRQNYTSGEGGDYAQTTVVVHVPAAGIYPIEIDYDYWYHAGRILLVEGSPTPDADPTIIPPLPVGVRENTQVRYVYRSSATGAQSNPSPPSVAESIPVLSNTYTSAWSPDPQIDLVDYYRIDEEVSDYTYVNTGPNDDSGSGTNTPVTDSLTDTELGNQLLNYDNFEPFPSIDLPQSGVCNVSGGVITWVSGGAIGGSATGFNDRWLPGTVISIGSPTSLPYILIARPVDNTITIPGVPDGENLAYTIDEPILANQPMPYLWGPTDNINFAQACGDTLRQGTFYWSAGSNLDAAPDTNQQDVTDPSEALVNGDISSGRGVLCSIRRWWTITPNQYNATATATGTTGSTWSLRLSPINRGLFIPRCVCVTGGGAIYARVDDGILYSPSGISAKSITDESLYPLFPHEGSTPQPVVRDGVTIYPPDDTQPEAQRFAYQNGYMYYTYGYSGSNVPVTHSAAFTPASVVNSGSGIPWSLPADATSEGAGTSQVALITGFSISGNVVSFVTAQQPQPFVEGQSVTPSGLAVGTYLNGEALTVLSTGLSATGFQAAFTHADVAATQDFGQATPATGYASASNVGAYTPPDGQYALLTQPTEGGTVGQAGGSCFGSAFNPWSFFALLGPSSGLGSGFGGCPLGMTPVGSTTGAVAIPSLPEGATVQSMIPLIDGGSFGSEGGGDAYFTLVAPSGDATVYPNGLWQGPNLGTNLSVLSEVSFGVTVENTAESAPGDPATFGAWASFLGVAINYTYSGTAIPQDQLQTLAGTNSGLDIPSDSPVTGIEITLQAGLYSGSGGSLTVQLTIDGSPIGIPKSVTVGDWATAYPLGGDGDLWGTTGLTGADVNGSNGIGVNISGALVDGQMNLNELAGEVFYTVNEEVEGNATLVFDEAAMGWAWDLYSTQATAFAPNEGESAQGVLVGCADGTVRTLSSSGTETVTGTVLSAAIGGVGWQYAYEMTIEYEAETGATISFVAADEGNNSYAPESVNLPATGGEPTKFTFKLSANKWKLLQIQIQTTDQTFAMYLEGAVIDVADWGAAEFRPVRVFTPAGGEGGEV